MVEISKAKLSNIIWIVFLLGVVAGFLAHDTRDAKEISIAANNIIADRTNYSSTRFLIQDDIFINWNDTNGTEQNK